MSVAKTTQVEVSITRHDGEILNARNLQVIANMELLHAMNSLKNSNESALLDEFT